jgi:hypothetical protein
MANKSNKVFEGTYFKTNHVLLHKVVGTGFREWSFSVNKDLQHKETIEKDF